MQQDLQGKEIIYIFELHGLQLEEIAIIDSVEGDKIYCTTNYGKKMIFNKDTGYCYTFNPAGGAKQYLKLNK